ncbi:MAG: diguanylate cyclase [Lachnospiraceae bacterium]|nr:diguanylate cyclase [Lachnospiraceae bacterium]
MEYFKTFNEESQKEYVVEASIGIYITEEGDKLRFEELVEKSDRLMYEEKEQRRKRQK